MEQPSIGEYRDHLKQLQLSPRADTKRLTAWQKGEQERRKRDFEAWEEVVNKRWPGLLDGYRTETENAERKGDEEMTQSELVNLLRRTKSADIREAGEATRQLAEERRKDPERYQQLVDGMRRTFREQQRERRGRG